VETRHPEHPEYVARAVAKILGARGGRARAKKLTTAQKKKIAAMGGKASAGKKNGRKKKRRKTKQ